MAEILKDELANDPLARDYAGMTDDLNTSPCKPVPAGIYP